MEQEHNQAYNEEELMKYLQEQGLGMLIPEEVLFADLQFEQPEKTEISRELWFFNLQNRIEDVQCELFSLVDIHNKVILWEDTGLRVSFYTDDENNLSAKPQEKGQIGFNR
jgi:hypothetical protein